MLGGCRIVVCSTCLSAKAAARRGKIQVEMRPFMASVAVIFGVDFTGPHILVVNTDSPLAARVVNLCGEKDACHLDGLSPPPKT